MKDIWEIVINEKYNMLVLANERKEAESIAMNFYNSNNYFLPKEIKTYSSKIKIQCKDIINSENKA